MLRTAVSVASKDKGCCDSVNKYVVIIVCMVIAMFLSLVGVVTPLAKYKGAPISLSSSPPPTSNSTPAPPPTTSTAAPPFSPTTTRSPRNDINVVVSMWRTCVSSDFNVFATQCTPTFESCPRASTYIKAMRAFCVLAILGSFIAAVFAGMMIQVVFAYFCYCDCSKRQDFIANPKFRERALIVMLILSAGACLIGMSLDYSAYTKPTCDTPSLRELGFKVGPSAIQFTLGFAFSLLSIYFYFKLPEPDEAPVVEVESAESKAKKNEMQRALAML